MGAAMYGIWQTPLATAFGRKLLASFHIKAHRQGRHLLHDSLHVSGWVRDKASKMSSA